MITTMAGGNTGDGKPATNIGIVSGYGIAADAADNLYLLDLTNGRVRKVSATNGIISTIAGNGNTLISGGDGGPAISASFRLPNAICADLQGNVYIGERGRIRKIDAATGIISTIAGTGIIGFSGDNGPATSAPTTSLVCSGWRQLPVRHRRYTRPFQSIPVDSMAGVRLAVHHLPAVIDITGLTTKIYPNPASEQVTVSIKGNISGKATVTLTDIWGKTLLRQEKAPQQNAIFTATLSLQGLTNGIYFITVSANQLKQVHKLFIQ